MSRFLLILLFLFSNAIWAQAVRVGVAQDAPPFSYVQDGKVVGIELDNARAIGALLALRMEIVPLPAPRLLNALQAGEVDVVMAGLTEGALATAEVGISRPYLKTGQMAIVLGESAGRFAYPWSIYGEGVRVGVVAATAGEAFAQKNITDGTVTSFSDIDAAIAALRKKEFDLLVHDAATSWRLATSSDQSDLFSYYRPLTDEFYVWAVRKDDIAMLQSLNDALKRMRGNGTLRYILNRWVPVSVEAR